MTYYDGQSFRDVADLVGAAHALPVLVVVILSALIVIALVSALSVGRS